MQKAIFFCALIVCFASIVTENVPTYQKGSDDVIVDNKTTKDKNELCPMIKYFGGSKNEHYDGNSSRFCKHIKNSCCKFEDFS